jgi:Domain of unknown function (DUF4307)
VVIGIVVLLGGLAVSIKLYRQYGAPPYQERLVSMSEFTDTSVEVTFDVQPPAGSDAVCVIRARNRAGAEVGRAEVTVRGPAAAGADGWIRTTYTLVTTGRGFVAEVQRCRPSG